MTTLRFSLSKFSLSNLALTLIAAFGMFGLADIANAQGTTGFNVVADDSFARTATSVGSGANSSTGVGNGWFDYTGNLYQITSSGNVANGATNTPPAGDVVGSALYRQASENYANGKVITYCSAVNGGAAGRINPTNGNGYGAILYATNQIFVYSKVAGVKTTIASAVSLGATASSNYAFEFIIQSNDTTHTQLTVKVYAVSANVVGAQIGTTWTAVDTTAALQNVSGAWGTASYGSSIFTRATTFAQGATVYTNLYTVAATPPASVLFTVPTAISPYFLTQNIPASFTVSASPAGSVMASAVVITPSVSGVTGTFSPSSVTFASGTTNATATFTLTPTSAGGGTLTTTNSGTLTDQTPQAINAFTLAQSPSIVLTGDSIMAGNVIGAQYAPGVFAQSLLQTLSGFPCYMYNAGASGTTSGQWLGTSDNLTTAMTNAAAQNPPCTIEYLTIGANDSKSTVATTAAQYKANIQAHISYSLAHGMTKIFLGLPIYIQSTVLAPWTTPGSNNFLRSYQVQLLSLVNQKTVFLGDIQGFNAFQYNPSDQSDGVHPVAATGSPMLGAFIGQSLYSGLYAVAPITSSVLYTGSSQIKRGR